MSLIKSLDHLNMTVKNLNATIEWYSRVLGFVVVEKGVQDGLPWAILRAGEALLCFYERIDLVFMDNAERSTFGLNHMCFRVTDRTKWEAIIQREPLEMLYNGPVVWPHSTAWYIADPTGHEIEITLWNDDHIAF